MKDYTNSEPVFSSSIKIVETSDPAHADNINEAPKQLLMNTLVLMLLMEMVYDASLVQEAFHNTFSKIEAIDETALTSEEIEEAIATEWNGESSADPTALSAEEIEEAIATEWNGETSTDLTALSAEEIREVIG